MKSPASLNADQIKSEQQLNEVLAAQSLLEQKRLRNQLKFKRIIGVIVILWFIASYLEWHYSRGQSTYLFDILVIGSVVNVFILSVENIFAPKP